MRVLYDLFPARVRVIAPEQREAALAASELNTFTAAFGRAVDKTRVIVTEKTVMVAADADNGPVLIFREKYDPASLVWSRKAGSVNRLVTLTGKLLVVSANTSCGCGSRLRSWNPYRTVYSSGDPVE